MQTIETKFVQGFINLMDGERDPQNLMIAFELHAMIMAQLDQTNLGYYHAEVCFHIRRLAFDFVLPVCLEVRHLDILAWSCLVFGAC